MIKKNSELSFPVKKLTILYELLWNIFRMVDNNNSIVLLLLAKFVEKEFGLVKGSATVKLNFNQKSEEFVSGFAITPNSKIAEIIFKKHVRILFQ
jgi:hypothetical protein